MRRRLTGFSCASFLILVAVMMFSATAFANQAMWKVGDNVVDAVTVQAGETVTVTLKAEIPAGKLLKAYSFTVDYDDEIIDVVSVENAANSAMAPLNINAGKSGKVAANSFDVVGVEGGVELGLINVSITGIKKGTTDVKTVFKAFGESSDNEFRPDDSILKVTVE